MAKKLQKNKTDILVYKAVFGKDKQKQKARFEIWQKATNNGIIPASINDFYMAIGANKVKKQLTVPAMNIRGMAYDTARAAFKSAKKHKVGAMIFELARSEMGYTDQSPQEYVIVMMAAALREGWTGPLFIQGDHFQAKAAGMGKAKTGEINTIKKLVTDAIEAGFYNIDIDMSTLVDLDKKKEIDQQKPNVKYSLEIANLVRKIEPKGVTVSLGGEIGHIGGKNSNLADFNAYMSGFDKGLKKGMVGMSKISVQTGTHHGGVVLADGSLADISVDFSILSSITKEGKKKYKMGGAVQHGASTLPDEFFSQFRQSEAVEVHLATGFQNIQMDHLSFPKKLLKQMYQWLDEKKGDERGKNQTNEQFHYSLRKKAWGEFKQQTWDITEENRTKIRSSLAKRFEFFFKELNVTDTQELILKHVKPVIAEKSLVDFAIGSDKVKEVIGLSD
ncbi:MAG: class II fructose-bisphosphate aldolase [Candidatus Pacebacteria bacterium]|nr:class II fructose-bisphosphate aldolase [Candidatus Paceibacterota bacterium]